MTRNSKQTLYLIIGAFLPFLINGMLIIAVVIYNIVYLQAEEMQTAKYYLIFSITMVIAFSISIVIYSIKGDTFKGQLVPVKQTLKTLATTLPALLALAYIYKILGDKYWGGWAVQPFELPIITVTFYVIIGPFLEELFYRGIILKKLTARSGTVSSILLVSLICAISHLITSQRWHYLLYIFMANIILSYSYVKGRLPASFLNHSLVMVFIILMRQWRV